MNDDFGSSEEVNLKHATTKDQRVGNVALPPLHIIPRSPL